MELCIFTEPQQGAGYDEQLAQARATERLGFDGWFRSDHYLRMGPGDPLPGPTDAWTTLAGLARETSRIRLGTLVSSLTFRHPGILAIQVAQVDAMSGGRVELGLGTGWFAAEHAAYGIPFPERRFDLLEEQLQVVRGRHRLGVRPRARRVRGAGTRSPHAAAQRRAADGGGDG
jgi:alkanesulfonate monooxygenase SsuD/methylene tetrahydromethanopterin reductase-like flavin-dependent oxidoreductase (luciferase family)